MIVQGDTNLNSVSQATNITTAVTLNASCGQITTQSATAAAGATNSFTFNNSYISASSSPIVVVRTYAGTLTTNGIPVVNVTAVAAGSCVVNISNAHSANALSGALTLGFVCA